MRTDCSAIGRRFEKGLRNSPVWWSSSGSSCNCATELAAVCHEDFTGRLHTVKRSQNERYYDVIKEFAAQSGTPVVLNTSFNENEPIVDTPEQAIACFLRTDMDALCAGPFITVKQGKSLPAPV